MTHLPPHRCGIALCGIKHAGKTSTALALARLSGMEMRDTDEVIRQKYPGKTVRQIFTELGETAFRRMEAETVRELCSDGTPRILALGGGTLSNPSFTEEDCAGLGYLCCLDVSDRVAYERICRKGLPPFLQGKSDPFAAFCEMNSARRETFHRLAHRILYPSASQTPEDTARKILAYYQEFLHE